MGLTIARTAFNLYVTEKSVLQPAWIVMAVVVVVVVVVVVGGRCLHQGQKRPTP